MKGSRSKKEFVNKFQKRTKKFAVEILKFCKNIPNSREGRIIADQLIRCGTSVGSNYRAACRSRSRKEFYAKICIVVEEADEALFWLEVIRDAGLMEGHNLENLLNESEEILSVVATSRKTVGKGFE